MLFPLQSRLSLYKDSMANRLQIEKGWCPSKAVHFKAGWWYGLWPCQSMWSAILTASKCNTVWTTWVVLVCNRPLQLVCQRCSLEALCPSLFQSRLSLNKDSIANRFKIEKGCCPSKTVNFKAGWWHGLLPCQSLGSAILTASKCNAVWKTRVVSNSYRGRVFSFQVWVGLWSDAWLG